MIIGLGLVASPCRLLANMTVANGVDVALKGAEARDVQVGTHRFYISAIVVTRTADRTTATGIIYHAWKYLPDDQIKYNIVVRDGIQTFDVQIIEGGLGQFLPLPVGLKDLAWRAMDDGWQLSGQEILDVIAAKIQAGN